MVFLHKDSYLHASYSLAGEFLSWTVVYLAL